MKKKSLLILAIAAAMALMMCACGDDEDSSNPQDWPDTEVAKIIPAPSGEITDISYDDDGIDAEMEWSEDEFNEYMSACKENGFTKKQDYSKTDYSIDYSAKDSDGNKLSIDYDPDEETGSIRLETAAYIKKTEKEDAEYEKQQAKKKKAKKEKAKREKARKEKARKKKAQQRSSSAGLDPNFKKAMDNYESFMDKYVAFMKKYNNCDDVSSMSADYMDMMEKYEKTQKKIDKIKNRDLTTKELAYYNEVTQRVLEKLSEIQ